MTKSSEMTRNQWAEAVTKQALDAATKCADEFGLSPFSLALSMHQIITHDLCVIDYDSARNMTIALLDIQHPGATLAQINDATARMMQAGETITAIVQRRVDALNAQLRTTPQVLQ